MSYHLPRILLLPQLGQACGHVRKCAFSIAGKVAHIPGALFLDAFLSMLRACHNIPSAAGSISARSCSHLLFIRLEYDRHIVAAQRDKAAAPSQCRCQYTAALRPVCVAVWAVPLAWAAVDRAGYVFVHASPSSTSNRVHMEKGAGIIRIILSCIKSSFFTYVPLTIHTVRIVHTVRIIRYVVTVMNGMNGSFT